MKIVVLGFDGFDPEYLSSLQKKYRFPGFSKIETDGLTGTIESTILPISAMAWTSFLTGSNPGKHGIFDFSIKRNESFKIATSDDRRMPAMWEYLNNKNIKTATVNIPLTYPVEPVNGVNISGYPTPDIKNGYYPRNIEERYDVDISSIHPETHYDGTNTDEVIQSQQQSWVELESLTKQLICDDELEVIVSVFKQTDDVAHIAWGDERLEKFYREADRVVNETIQELEENEEEYLLFVLSDHGFGEISGTLYLNNILRELGYINFKKSVASKARVIGNKIGITPLNIYKLLARIGFGESIRDINSDNSLFSDVIKHLRKSIFLSIEDIDPDDSLGYSSGNYGQIFTFEDSDISTLADDLTNYCVAGEKIIDEVIETENHFFGDEVDNAPDIIIKTKDMKYVTARGFDFGSNQSITDHVINHKAEHQPYGIFYAYGSNDLNDTIDDYINLEQILPTILSSLNLPVPNRIDGTPIQLYPDTEWTTETYNLNNETENDIELTEQEERRMQEQLESLGYSS